MNLNPEIQETKTKKFTPNHNKTKTNKQITENQENQRKLNDKNINKTYILN